MAVVAGVLACAGCAASGHEASKANRYAVDGVRLVRAPPAVRATCMTASRRLRVVIFCPTRVPPKWGTQIEVCTGCNGTFSATGSFHGPRDYVGVPGAPGWGHLTVWAATQRLIDQGFVGCTDGRTLNHETIAGRRTTWIFCPPGSELDSGHVLVEWSSNHWIYALSLHSNTAMNRQLLRIMAEHVAEVR